jgi:hypothetical protein
MLLTRYRKDGTANAAYAFHGLSGSITFTELMVASTLRTDKPAEPCSLKTCLNRKTAAMLALQTSVL